MNSLDKEIIQSALNNTVVSLTTLIKQADLRLSKATIRRELCKAPGYPALSLSDIGIAFDRLGIEHVIGEAKNSLHDLVPPFLCHFNETSSEEVVEIFTVVVEVTADRVFMIHPKRGMLELTEQEFQKSWDGIVVAITSDDVQEVNYREKLKAEQADDNNYKRSIKIEDEFLSPAECERIIQYVNTKASFSRSAIGLDGIQSTHRTSFSCIIDESDDPIFSAIIERIALKNAWPIDKIENMQCVRYLPGQQFKTHFDADEHLRRERTVLVYLNENFEGGKTFFPELQFVVEPRSGRSVSFNNLNKLGDVIVQSAHAGLPVTSGIKYACNFWLRA